MLREMRSVLGATFPWGCLPTLGGILKAWLWVGANRAREEMNSSTKGQQNR